MVMVSDSLDEKMQTFKRGCQKFQHKIARYSGDRIILSHLPQYLTNLYNCLKNKD